MKSESGHVAPAEALASASVMNPGTDQGVDIRTAVANQFMAIGWYNPPGFNASIGSKRFATAVGEKEASVYLEDWGTSYRLTAQYDSEGRNVLDSISVFIRKEMNLSQLIECVTRFASSVDERVDESYARRLYLRWSSVEAPKHPQASDEDIFAAPLP